MWGANTFPVRKYNSRTFHLKFVVHVFFWFFRRFPQINVGGDSARIPFVKHASHESRVALPLKGRLRQYVFILFTGVEGRSVEYEEPQDLRSNPFQGAGNDTILPRKGIG